MPEMCGRLCPQERLCEGHCVVGKNAKPVAIGRLEAFVADAGVRSRRWPAAGQQRPRRCRRRRAGRDYGRREKSWRRGYAVTMFDAWPETGGVLRYGIPNFKLEKHVLDEWIERLEELAHRVRRQNTNRHGVSEVRRRAVRGRVRRGVPGARRLAWQRARGRGRWVAG